MMELTWEPEKRPRISFPSHIFRRLLHLLSPLLLIYYLFPDRLAGIPSPIILILVVGLVPLVIEVLRLKKGKVLFGQRPHEDRALGSYAWSLWSSLLIILVMPQQIALPTIIVYSFTDPILGEIRTWRKALVYPLGFVFTCIMFVLLGYNPLLAAYSTVFMLLGEAVELHGTLRVRPELMRIYGFKGKEFAIGFKTDDDGTTQLVPALFLGLLYLIWPGVFPDPLFYPLTALGG